jgi:hypothetical protein
MRKLLFILTLFLAPSVFAQGVAVSGNLKDLGTANVTSQSTRVEFKLKGFGGQIPGVTGVGKISTEVKIFRPDANGAISGSIYSNSQIDPSGTFYSVCIFDAGQLFRCNSYNITGAFNLNTAVPISTTPSATVNTVVTQSYSQSFTSLTTWTVTHNFADPKTICHFFDTAGNEFNPDLKTRTNDNTFTALFVVATSGSATCFRAGQFALTQGSLSLNDVFVKVPGAAQASVGDFPFNFAGAVNACRVNNIRFVGGTCALFPATRAGLQSAIDDLPARGGLVVINATFALDATTLTVGSNGAGDPYTGKSVMLYFASSGAWTGTANPMFLLAGRSGITGLGRSTYLQNTGASGARLIDIAHPAEAVIIRDLGLLSKGPAIKCQGSCSGVKWSNLFLQSESGSTIETQSWLDTAEASGIFISHQSATGSCWRMGVTGTGGSLEWGMNGGSIRDLTCQTGVAGAGPSLHWEADGGTPNNYGSSVMENIQIINPRKEAFKIRGNGPGPFRIANVKIAGPVLDAGTYDAITIGTTGSLYGITLEGVEGQTAAYRYGIDWTSGAGRIKHVSMGSTTATVNVNNQIILQDVNATIAGGIKVPRFVSNGTALAAGDFTNAGWGTAPSIGSVVGTDQGFEFIITSGTGTPSASPTVTLTFKDLTWTNSPIASCGMKSGGTGAIQQILPAPTATTLVMTYNGTPATSVTFPISCTLMGR